MNFGNFGKWKRRLIDDFRNKEFLPIKILFFLSWGAHMSLIPFLTLQARSLGINEKEVGIIYSFIPFASLIAPPVSGYLADRIGNFKILLSMVTATAGLTSLLFLLVPPGRITHTLPQVLPIDIACSEGHGANLRVVPPYICEPVTPIDWFSIKVEDCTVSCHYTGLTVEDSNLSCRNSTNCFDGEEHSHSNHSESLSLANPFSSMNVIIKRVNDSVTNDTYESDSFLCPNLAKNYKEIDNCITLCKATALREDVCKNNESIEIRNPSLTFYSHLVIRVLKEFTLSSSMPLLDGAAVTILKEHDGDFGFQRMFANLGMMSLSPISGILIDYFSVQNGFQDFRSAMYMYCAIKLLAAFIMLFLNLNFKQASNKVMSDFSSLMFNPEIVCFFIATFLAGTCYGFIETFLFWLLEDLGADKRLMGLTLTVGCLFGIPVLMISTFILKKFGHVNAISIGFFVYVLRFLGYTFISNPWWAMPFEALECATVSLMYVSFMSYAAVLSTPATVVTLQGAYGGLYNGVGRGAGSLIGGFMIHTQGIINAFRIIAAFAGCCGILYFIVNILFLRKLRQVRVEARLQAKQMRKAKEELEKKSTILEMHKTDSKTEIIKADYNEKNNGKMHRDDSSKTNLGFECDNIV